MRLDSIDYLCCPACTSGFRLTIEKQTEAKVVQGTLECPVCNRRFSIKDGLPDLTFPEVLDYKDLKQKRYYDKKGQRWDQANRRWDLALGIWELCLWENRARRKLIDRLELKKDASVLETGVGTGSNLPIIASQIGKHARIDGIDISSGVLRAALQRMNPKAIQAELIQGNASPVQQ
jgi:uncharacterized protein YbaR (Trm112 family)